MNPRMLTIGIYLLVLLSIGSMGTSRAVDAPPVVAGGVEVVPGELLVGVRAETDDRWQAARLTTNFGAAVARHPALHAYRYQLRAGTSVESAITRLRRRRDVLYAEPDHIVRTTATPNDALYASQQYGPQKVQADLAWGIWQPSAQVILAVVDTGIDNSHPDLTNKMLRDAGGNVLGYNSLTGVAGPASDDFGHGTHCAGIAAAQVDNGLGIAGIAGWSGVAGATDASYTRLMPVKALDSTGAGTDASLSSGITWAADHGAKVISMSVGEGSYSATLDNAIQYAWGKGCVVVAAAGNMATSAKFYPAAMANVLSVAATDKNDALTYYSNWGSWVLTAAPGGGNTSTDSIFSTLPTYAAGGGFGLNYGAMSGTSMATPHVAGEAALILSQNPSLTNAQVEALITTNVDAYTPYRLHTLAAGAGRINVYRALQAAGTGPISAAQPPPSPTGLTAAAGNTQISLSWNASAGAASYTVKRSSTSGGPYSTIAAGVGAASFTDRGLTNSVTCYYVVSAANSSGESGNSNQAAATPQPPLPAAPTNLVAAGGNAQVSLTWNASAGASGYNVKRATVSGGPYATIATNIGAVTYTNLGLTNGTTYSYVVSALNAAGESANSAQSSATPTAPLQPPAAPTNVKAVAANAQVTLSWTGSAAATTYTVQRSATSGGPYLTVPGGGGIAGTSFVDGGLTNGTTYYYVVTAANAAGSSPNSAQVSATPSAGGAAPAPPTGLVAVFYQGSVAMAWKQSATAGVMQNRIYRATVSGGPYALLATVNAVSPNGTYPDRTVASGTTYFYVVTAVNGSALESAYSNQVSAAAR